MRTSSQFDWHAGRTRRNHQALFLTAALIAFVFFSLPLRADIDAAIAAYDSGDYEVALNEFLPLAKAGEARAQLLLGLMYDNGLGTMRDVKQAFLWYQRAAQQGVLRAQFNVGSMYSAGEGVAQSDRQAAHWYQLAATNGFPEAQYRYGLALAAGRGVDRDETTAYMWLHLAGLSRVPGSEQAHAARDRLGAGIEVAEREAALRRAEEWLRIFRSRNMTPLQNM